VLGQLSQELETLHRWLVPSATQRAGGTGSAGRADRRRPLCWSTGAAPAKPMTNPPTTPTRPAASRNDAWSLPL
jgi:hypothetical protein